MSLASIKYRRQAAGPLTLGLLALLCLAGSALAGGAAPRYAGRVLYRANKAPVPGVLVEVVEADDDGKPTDEVLGSARADAAGNFTVALKEASGEKLALVVSAVRASAESGGDRRQEGYEIRKRRIVLGYLSFPSAAKPNTIYIERRKAGRPSGDDE